MRLRKTKKHLQCLMAFLLATASAYGQQWQFDDDSEFVDGQMRYVADDARHAAECRGFADGQSADAITVPATVNHDGKSYNVVSVSGGAFLNASVAEAHLLSPMLQLGELVFGGTLQRLYMSAVVPPALEFYLAIDVQTFLPPMTRVYVPTGTMEAYLANEWWAKMIIIDGEERSASIATNSAGTLQSEILGQGLNLRGVNHLTVSGPLNSDDIYLIRDSMTSLFTLDLSQAAIRQLPKEAFLRCRFSSIKLPATLQQLGSSAFGSCQNLEELDIPEGVLVADNLISNCSSLKRLDLPSTLVSAKELMSVYAFDETTPYSCTITCRSFFPPDAGNAAVSVWFGDADIKLRVPAVSASAYAEAKGWKNLPIETIGELPQQIAVLGQQTLDTDGLPADYHPDLNILQQGNYGGYGPNNAFGVLTVTGSQPLDVRAFTAFTDLSSDRYYNGHYSSELITETPMTAQSVTLDFSILENSWFFMAFPFDVKLSDVVTDSRIRHWVVRTYSGSNRAAMRGEQWLDIPYSGTLEARHGYIWQVKESDSGHTDLRFSVKATGTTINNMFAHEDVSIPLSDYPSTYEHNVSWNMVGNPYPCYYRIGALKQTMPITVWKGYIYDQYATYSPIDDGDHVLHPYEAFFVQKPASESAIVFGVEGRVTPGSGNARAKVPANEMRRIVNLTLTADSLSDRTRVVLNPEAKGGYERERDAAKFFTDSEQVPQLYTFIDATPCAINERPEGDGMVRLGVRTGSEQLCTITLGECMVNVLLEDRMTGCITNLTESESYTFTSCPGRDDHRFLLHLGASANGISDASYQTDGTIPRRYTLQGVRVSDGYKGIVIEKGKRIIKK